MTLKSHKTGYVFALAAFTIFAVQDAISKHLGGVYPPVMIAMVRYWAFAVFAVIIAARSNVGLNAAVRTRRPLLQLLRGVLLATQIVTAIMSFSIAGLAHSQAIFSATPLLVAMLSVPILGEHVGWRRWTAIVVGLCGVLVILKPDVGMVDTTLAIPVLNAILLALYAIVTRLVSRDDPAATSFFYIGVVGAVVMSAIGPFYWTPLSTADWGWMALLCATGMSSHYCLIKAYDNLDAVLVQPISYLQLVFACLIGMAVFGETLHLNVIVGSVIVVAAGLFTVWREARNRRARLSAAGPDDLLPVSTQAK